MTKTYFLNKALSSLKPNLISARKRLACNAKSLSLLLLVLMVSANSWGAGELTQSNFTSVLTPQFVGSGTSTRLPLMFRATVSGLTASTEYRYYIQAATNSTVGGGTVDFGSTNSGAGNPLLINSTGTTYTYVTNTSISTAGRYETFTTDASGNYTGWFGFVNTGNARFTAGNILYPTITLNGGGSSTTITSRFALNVGMTCLAYATSAGATNGSFLQSVSGATSKNLIALYDNIAGTGRPLFISPVESIENTGATLANVVAGYSTSAGSWNAIIPNDNANGVRRIEQLSSTDGSIIASETSTDGIWPTGSINTVNPTNGAATALVIATADNDFTSTGLNKNLNNSILIYTDNNGITVSLNDEKLIGTEVSVYNALGQKLISKRLNNPIMHIEYSFAPNVYLVKVDNITKKIIVK